jgi:hypothetical protein
MPLTSRFIFNGSAAAFGGHLVRPQNIVLASTGGSALATTGGRSTWRERDIKFGRSFRIRQAETFAEGLVDNLRDAVRVTHRRLAADQLSTTTRVSARCRGVEVGGAPPLKRGDEPEPTMSVADVACTLVSRSNPPGHESSVIVDSATISPVIFESPIHGVFRLDVTIEIGRFRKADTRGKVIANRDIPQKHGDRDMVFSTIVTKLEWQKGRAYPGSKFVRANAVYIPNLGEIAFGELIVQTGLRRLTMVQMELGSPTGGSASIGAVETNGSWPE